MGGIRGQRRGWRSRSHGGGGTAWAGGKLRESFPQTNGANAWWLPVFWVLPAKNFRLRSAAHLIPWSPAIFHVVHDCKHICFWGVRWFFYTHIHRYIYIHKALEGVHFHETSCGLRRVFMKWAFWTEREFENLSERTKRRAGMDRRWRGVQLRYGVGGWDQVCGKCNFFIVGAAWKSSGVATLEKNRKRSLDTSNSNKLRSIENGTSKRTLRGKFVSIALVLCTTLTTLFSSN